MGGCLSKPWAPREKRPSSRSSSFCCAGVPVASFRNAPSDMDFKEPMWTVPPLIATVPEGSGGGGAKGQQLSPPARAILLDSFQWATASAPFVSSQLHHEAIGITMSESMTRTATNSDRSTTLSLGVTVGPTDEYAAQGRVVLPQDSCKNVGKRQPSLASIRAGGSIKRRGMVKLSVEQSTTCPREGSSNTSPRSLLQRPRTSSPATLEPPNSPDDMEFITNALDHPSEPVQAEGPRSEYQFTRSGGWNKITVQENSGKDGECSGRMWWKKDGEPICM